MFWSFGLPRRARTTGPCDSYNFWSENEEFLDKNLIDSAEIQSHRYNGSQFYLALQSWNEEKQSSWPTSLQLKDIRPFSPPNACQEPFPQRVTCTANTQLSKGRHNFLQFGEIWGYNHHQQFSHNWLGSLWDSYWWWLPFYSCFSIPLPEGRALYQS